jgi:hypothetical protein
VLARLKASRVLAPEPVCIAEKIVTVRALFINKLAKNLQLSVIAGFFILTN